MCYNSLAKYHAKITGTRRLEKNLVEAVAMREAIVNCIVHNDFSHEIPPVFEIFSDKIVMTSYGGLILGQSIEDFFSCSSMPRNRELMRVFKDVGLVGTKLGIKRKFWRMNPLQKADDCSIIEVRKSYFERGM